MVSPNRKNCSESWMIEAWVRELTQIISWSLIHSASLLSLNIIKLNTENHDIIDNLIITISPVKYKAKSKWANYNIRK